MHIPEFVILQLMTFFVAKVDAGVLEIPRAVFTLVGEQHFHSKSSCVARWDEDISHAASAFHL